MTWRLRKSRHALTDKKRDLLYILQRSGAHFTSPQARLSEIRYLFSTSTSPLKVYLFPSLLNLSSSLIPLHISSTFSLITFNLSSLHHTSLFHLLHRRQSVINKPTKGRNVRPLSPIHSCCPFVQNGLRPEVYLCRADFSKPLGYMTACQDSIAQRGENSSTVTANHMLNVKHASA